MVRQLPDGEVQQQRHQRPLVVHDHFTVGHAGPVAIEPQVHAGIGQRQVVAARIVEVLAQHRFSSSNTAPGVRTWLRASRYSP